jgi:hypothetical protein
MVESIARVKTISPYLITSALVAGAVLLAVPANGAPSGRVTAKNTVESLQAQGYHVVISRTGAAPLEECSVSAVRRGQTVGAVHVDLTC